METSGNKTDQWILFFEIGFRPFFTGATLFSILSMTYWFGIFALEAHADLTEITLYQWHAHQMIYGYCMAVIAGFLLTAVTNWTGMATAQGRFLALIFLAWLLARILFYAGSGMFVLAGFFDLLFVVSVLYATTRAVVRARSWKQLVILTKLAFLGLANLVFYLGYAGYIEQGVFWGIYGGFYLVISLIITLGARVIPFFISRGVGYTVELSRPTWISPVGIVLFLIFFISELFLQKQILTAVCGAALFLLYSYRLYGWHTPGIWRKPLLWSLYIAMLFINLGFLLFALVPFTGISKYLAIHALAYGGIGLITLAMMARVSLGHTGRDVHNPPKTVLIMLALLLAGAVFRIILPLLNYESYTLWILLSQVLWILAYLVFIVTYLPILISVAPGEPFCKSN